MRSGYVLALVLLLTACKEEETTKGYCEVVVERLRECGVIGEGRFEACVDYYDAAEPCETECWSAASCADIVVSHCGLGTGLGPTDFGTCVDRCLGLEPYECADGQLVWALASCSGVPDCVDASDELNCDETVSLRKCRNVDQTVPSEQWCDDQEDCSDGSDELDCEIVLECETEDGAMLSISPWLYCNGVVDCADEADEPEGCAVSTCG